MSEPAEMDLGTTRDLVEELLRTSFALQDVIGSRLKDMPEGALGGEDNALARELADRKTEK